MRKKIVLAVTLLFLLSFSITFAQVLPTTNQVEAWNEFNGKYSGKFEMVWHKKTGTPKVITGYKNEPAESKTDNPEKSAMEFLKNNKGLFNSREGIDGFILKHRKDHGFMRHLQFTQTYRGIKVHTGGYRISLDKNGRLHMLNGRFHKDININTIPSVSKEEALNTAVDFLKNEYGFLSETTESELVIYPENGNFLLTYKIEIQSKSSIGHWMVFINAATGELIKHYSLIIEANGQGWVATTMPDNYSIETLPRINSQTSKSKYLDGENVEVYNHYKSYDRVETIDYDFSSKYYTEFPEFDQVNVYYHVDKYVQDKIDDGFDVISDPVEAFVDVEFWEVPFAGAQYPGDILYFCGDGERKISRDRDVIYHETQHLITHNICDLDRNLSESAALDEGYADYFAASFTGNPEIAEYFWIPYLRTCDNNKTYADFDYSDPIKDYCHENGLIWSGALWDLKQAVGSTVTDYTTLKSLYYMDEYADFEDAFYALRWANLTYYGGWHIETINSVFAARGIPPGGGKIAVNDENKTESLPVNFRLYQNYPNPFNPETTIKFSLPEESKVMVVIYNIQGKEVTRLLNGNLMEKGIHNVKWNAGNLSSGVYLVKIKSGKFEEVKKAVLVK